MANPCHPLTSLLLVDIPEAHARKFHEAVCCLNKCASCLTHTGVSSHLDNAIKLEAERLRELNKEFYMRSMLQMMTCSACWSLAMMPNGADAFTFQTIAVTINYKLNYSSQDKKKPGFPEDFCLSLLRINPHLRHILELTVAELGRQWHTKCQTERLLPQKELIAKAVNSMEMLTECDMIISNQAKKSISHSKKGLTILKDRVRNLVASHNIEYFTLKKNEIDLCNLMLGPNAARNMHLIVTKLKLEYEEKVQRNQEKRNKLALFEEQGVKLKKIAEAYIELEKKIRYTKATLNKLESML